MQNAVKPKFVLFLAAHHRDILGPDGTDIHENLHSDEIRVASLNRLLEGRARVITMNKRPTGKYHFQVNFLQPRWPIRFAVWLENTLNGVITDIYLDYFFFLQSWYRFSYGTKWIKVLRQIDYTGTAYLPIPKCPATGESVVQQDRVYHQNLVNDVINAGGSYIKNIHEIAAIPLCAATINEEEILRNKCKARTHSWQIKNRIAGILAITRQQLNIDGHTDAVIALCNFKTTNQTPMSVSPSPPLPASASQSRPLPTSVSASRLLPASVSSSLLPLLASVVSTLPPMVTSVSASLPSSTSVSASLSLPVSDSSASPLVSPSPSLPMSTSVSASLPSSTSVSASLSLPASDSSVSPSLPFSVKVDLEDARKYIIVTKRKQGKLQIILPTKLTGNNKRGYIAFSKCTPFGVNPEFGKFLQRKLVTELNRWHKVADAHKWYQNDRVMWKQRVQNNYRIHVKRNDQRIRVATTRSSRQVSLVYNTKSTDSVVIPLPDFPELQTSKSKTGEVQAIRIRVTKATAKNKAAAHLYLPGALFNPAKGKRFSLGTEHGINPNWVRFVTEHLSYCVHRWKSFDDVQRWVQQYKTMFVSFVQKLWKFEGGNAKPVNKYWSIRPSSLPVDQEYVEKGWFQPSADPGYGLWCTEPDTMLTIWFTGPEGITVRNEGTMYYTQGFYAADIDDHSQIVPDMNCFKCCVLHHSFLVGHRRVEKNPTHYGVVINGVPCLKPRRPCQIEEICFDYGYHLSGVKTHTTKPDP